MANNLRPPEAISATCVSSDFDCGVEALNLFLRKHALQNQMNGSARSYVSCRANKIVGYYTLAFGSVRPDEAPSRVSQGLARHPIPIMLLARLAVDRSEQGRGLGKALLKDSLLRTLQASKIAGLRAMVVHAKDESAKAFYAKYGFAESPIDRFHLFLLIKDLQRALQI